MSADETCKAKDNLRRFLYLSVEANSFLTDDPEKHDRFDPEHVNSLTQLLSKDPALVCRIVSAVNSENALPRRETIFFVLAVALTCKVPISDTYRRELYSTLLFTCKSDEDFFCFVKYASKYKKTFSSGLNKVVKRYYKQKEPLDLVKDVCKRKGYHTWTHKDLIKLSHIKSSEPLFQLAITYIVKGLQAAEDYALENNLNREMLDYAKKNIEFKNTKSEDAAIKYIEEHQLGFDGIPAHFQKNPKVLQAVLKHIDIPSLLNALVKLWKHGVLRHDSPAMKLVVETLSSPEKVKASGVHPVEVFIALRYFEKGGKPRDARFVTYLEEKERKEKEAAKITEYTKTNFALVEPIKCPPVVSALNKCLLLSYQNIVPTHRRFLITIEVSDNMEKGCLTSKWVNGYEAALVESMAYLKSEKNVIVAVFNGPSITQVTLDKGGSIAQGIKKLKDADHGEIHMGAPIEWARKKKKAIDVFINIVHTPNHKHFMEKDNLVLNPREAFVNYKKAMNMSSTKLVLRNLHQACTTLFPESLLDIRGLDKNVPKVIDAYIKNLV